MKNYIKNLDLSVPEGYQGSYRSFEEDGTGGTDPNDLMMTRWYGPRRKGK